MHVWGLLLGGSWGSWGAFGKGLDTLGAFWWSLCTPRASWGIFGASWGFLGHFGGGLRRLWEALGAFWGVLGLSWQLWGARKPIFVRMCFLSFSLLKLVIDLLSGISGFVAPSMEQGYSHYVSTLIYRGVARGSGVELSMILSANGAHAMRCAHKPRIG